MGKLNKDISQNFNKYEVLVKERKHTTQRTIKFLTTKANRKDVLYDESPIQHTTVEEDMSLIVEQKINNAKDFKFKLRCKALTNEPFFRFDSAGATHRNNSPEIPLVEQIVTTPHFNAFDKDGRSIAYKTDKLKEPNEAQALEDINLSFTHFCFEANIRYPENDFTQIDPVPSGELELDANEDDVLSNVNFGL